MENGGYKVVCRRFQPKQYLMQYLIHSLRKFPMLNKCDNFYKQFCTKTVQSEYRTINLFIYIFLVLYFTIYNFTIVLLNEFTQLSNAIKARF